MKLLMGADCNNQRLRAVADPSAATDAATRQYVDNLVAGMRWKDPVRVATTTNGALATAYANGQTVDGVVLATGDRILLKNQTAAAENGIYTVAASGAPARANDANTAAKLAGAAVMVAEGTTNADRVFVQTADSITLGTTGLTWTQIGMGTTYSADGQGIELSGTTFLLELDGTTLAKSAAGLRVGSGAAGAGLVEASGVLAVGQGTGITVAADAISVDTAVTGRAGLAFNVGDGAATTVTLTHNFATYDVEVQVVENSGGRETVYPDVTRPTTNTVAIVFPTAPAAGAYRAFVRPV